MAPFSRLMSSSQSARCLVLNPYPASSSWPNTVKVKSMAMFYNQRIITISDRNTGSRTFRTIGRNEILLVLAFTAGESTHRRCR